MTNPQTHFTSLYVHFGYAGVLLSTSTAGCWTEKEATNLYQRKLIQLLSLYKGQMIRLRHVFRERRRAFLIQWQREGGSKLQGMASTLIQISLCYTCCNKEIKFLAFNLSYVVVVCPKISK